jgi:hypothetical protein
MLQGLTGHSHSSENTNEFILAHVLATASSHLYQPLRKIWIEIAVTDPGAFHVTLGNTATFLAKLKGDNSPMKDPEIVGHYGRSVTLLRRRLTNPTDSVREGTIANILAHLCLSVSFPAPRSFRYRLSHDPLIDTTCRLG